MTSDIGGVPEYTFLSYYSSMEPVVRTPNYFTIFFFV